MANILLWIENLAVGLLWTAMWAAGLMRLGRPRLRWWLAVLIVGVPLVVFYLPVWGLAGLFWIKLGMYWAYFAGLSLLVLAFVAGSCLIVWRAFRSAPRFWSRSGLAIAWVAAVLLHLITFSSIDLSVRIRLASLRAEASALALSAAPPLVPDEQNAAVDYRRAFALMDAGRPWDEKWDRRWDEWLDVGCSSLEESPGVDGEAIGRFLQESGPILDHLRRGAAKPICNFERSWDRLAFDILLPELRKARAAGALFSLSARWHAMHSRTHSAACDVRDVLRLAEHLGQEPILISTLTCVGIRQNAIEQLRFLLDNTQPQRSDLEMIQAGLERSTPVSRLVSRSLRTEMAIGMSLWVALSGGQNLAEVYQGLTQGSGAPPSFFAGIRPLGPCYWVFLALDDLAGYRALMDRYIHWSSQPYYQIRSKMEPFEKSYPQTETGFWARIIFPAMGGAIRRVVLADTHTLCVLAALAAKRYQLDHGRWPADWAALCPAYLDLPPVDPYTGQPLRMKEENQALVIYSPGPDDRDEGGAPFNWRARTGDIAFRLRP